MKPPNILFFGSAEASHRYPRTLQVMARLEELGFGVHSALRQRTVSSKARVRAFTSLVGGVALIADMLAGWGRSLWMTARTRPDAIWIAYPGLLDLLPALLLPRRFTGPVIYDAMICWTQTIVEDRKLLRHGRFGHRLLILIERALLRRASLVVTDTPENRDYLLATFGLPPDQVRSLPISIDSAHWQYTEPVASGDTLHIAFWGTFVPLQGTPTIARAINQVADRLHGKVQFRIAGDGQDAETFSSLLTPQGRAILLWQRRLVSEKELRILAAWSHACLGIFGESDKAQRVVPYKVLQALASGRHVITMGSPAISPLTDSGAFTVVPADDAEALVAAIEHIYLARTAILSSSTAARRLFDALYAHEAQREGLRQLLQSQNLLPCIS